MLMSYLELMALLADARAIDRAQTTFDQETLTIQLPTQHGTHWYVLKAVSQQNPRISRRSTLPRTELSERIPSLHVAGPTTRMLRQARKTRTGNVPRPSTAEVLSALIRSEADAPLRE